MQRLVSNLSNDFVIFDIKSMKLSKERSYHKCTLTSTKKKKVDLINCKLQLRKDTN